MTLIQLPLLLNPKVQDCQILLPRPELPRHTNALPSQIHRGRTDPRASNKPPNPAQPSPLVQNPGGCPPAAEQYGNPLHQFTSEDTDPGKGHSTTTPAVGNHSHSLSLRGISICVELQLEDRSLEWSPERFGITDDGTLMVARKRTTVVSKFRENVHPTGPLYRGHMESGLQRIHGVHRPQHVERGAPVRQ